MKKIILILILAGCAKEKTIVINGKPTVVQPYGWANEQLKNDSVVYQINIGNVIWDCITIESVVVPVVLTGWQLYEPVEKKPAPVK